METMLMPYSAIEHIPAKSILVLAPHPDDEVFGCGSALLRSIQVGIPVHVIVVSNGAYNAKNSQEKEQIIAKRQSESQQAARVLGYGEPEFWNYEDRHIYYGEELILRLIDAIKNTQADLIYSPSIQEMHPDHRSLAMAVLEAVRRLEKPIQVAMYEIGIPIRPNILVDITPVWPLKQQAMKCFSSQLEIQRYDDHITGLNRYRTYTLDKDSIYAEAFCLIESDKFDTDFLSIYESEYEKQAKLFLPVPLMGLNMPKVSVLVRSIDRPELKETLNSIAIQTYPIVEVVVVNAKGKGHSSIANKCGRFPIIFVDSEKKLTRSQAANLAIAHASGDFFIFLDDDDIFLPDHLYTLVTALMANPEHQVAYTAIQCIDARRNKLQRIFNSSFDSILLLAGNYIPIHAAMFSRKLVERGCKIDEKFDLYEDWDFWIQASQYTNFLFIPKITAYYRISDTSGIGIRPDHIQQQQTIHKLFQKWRNLWTKEVLEYVIARIGMQNLNPTLIQLAQNALYDEKQSNIPQRIAVVLHLFYEDLWPEIKEYLKNIPSPFDLIITMPYEKATTIKSMVQADYADANFIPLENRGRDILPFITVLPKLIQKNYTCVCKIHTKKSHDAVDGNAWRKDIFNSLLGDSTTIKNIITRFKDDTSLGILGHKKHFISCATYPDVNISRLSRMAERLLHGISQRDWHFFAGSMFWFRPIAMLPLLELGIKIINFESEDGQKEGTLAHIVERLFPLSAQAANLTVQTIEDEQIDTYYHYPFTLFSVFEIMQEKNRLYLHVQKIAEALKTAEILATERLNIIISYTERIQETQKALQFAEKLANERLNQNQQINNQLQETQKALQFAEKLANERLNQNQQINNQLQETQKALQFAEKLANERSIIIEELQQELQKIKQNKVWKICNKLNLV